MADRVKVKTAQSPWPDNLATKIGVAVYCDDAQSDFNLLRNRGLRCDSLKKICKLATTCGDLLCSGIWKSTSHWASRPIGTRLDHTQSSAHKNSARDNMNS